MLYIVILFRTNLSGNITYFFSSIVAFITEELHRNFTEIEPRALNILTDLA